MPDVCLNQVEEKFLPSKHPFPPSHLTLPTASSPPDCSPRQVRIPPLSEPSRFWTDAKINHGQCPLDTGCVTQAIGAHWHNVIEPLFEVNTPLPLVLTMHKSKLALVAEFLLVVCAKKLESWREHSSCSSTSRWKLLTVTTCGIRVASSKVDWNC